MHYPLIGLSIAYDLEVTTLSGSWISTPFHNQIVQKLQNFTLNCISSTFLQNSIIRQQLKKASDLYGGAIFHHWYLYRHLCDLPGLFKKINELIIQIANLGIHHKMSKNDIDIAKLTSASHGDGCLQTWKKMWQTSGISD